MATKKIVETPKKEHPQKAFTNILMRIVAVFAANGLAVIGAGAIAGVPLWKACFMAGIAGVATVVAKFRHLRSHLRQWRTVFVAANIFGSE